VYVRERERGSKRENTESEDRLKKIEKKKEG